MIGFYISIKNNDKALSGWRIWFIICMRKKSIESVLSPDICVLAFHKAAIVPLLP